MILCSSDKCAMMAGVTCVKICLSNQLFLHAIKSWIKLAYGLQHWVDKLPFVARFSSVMTTPIKNNFWDECKVGDAHPTGAPKYISSISLWKKIAKSTELSVFDNLPTRYKSLTNESCSRFSNNTDMSDDNPVYYLGPRQWWLCQNLC